MFVAGVGANKRVALTNSEFDGRTSWSATCNGKHYWAIYTTGSNDRITMSGNYIHETSGRGPVSTLSFSLSLSFLETTTPSSSLTWSLKSFDPAFPFLHSCLKK
uniref:Polisaccharide lyase family 1 protein n=1 Tax=Phaffia rhodozyma TaxID=264483 RepID=A0A1I9Q713_PHARH|nr:polisaccharide lyase family 1 protein [Phaffia rhodozyma]